MATYWLPTDSRSGRGDWIRTSDPLRPRQVRYQAALRPDPNLYYRRRGPLARLRPVRHLPAEVRLVRRHVEDAVAGEVEENGLLLAGLARE